MLDQAVTKTTPSDTPKSRFEEEHLAQIQHCARRQYPISELLPELPGFYSWRPTAKLGRSGEIAAHNLREDIHADCGAIFARASKEFHTWPSDGRRTFPNDPNLAYHGKTLLRTAGDKPAFYQVEIIQPHENDIRNPSIICWGAQRFRVAETDDGRKAMLSLAKGMSEDYGSERREVRLENAWDGAGGVWHIHPTVGGAEFLFRAWFDRETKQPEWANFVGRYYPPGIDYHFEMQATFGYPPKVSVKRVRSEDPKFFRQERFRETPSRGFNGNLRSLHCTTIRRCFDAFKEAYVSGLGETP